MIARRLGAALTVVVLVTSGTYMLVYLYRWEWNRALVAGLFFVAAELAVVAGTLHRRLTRLEKAVLDVTSRDRPGGTEEGSATLDAVREAAPAKRSPFAWLDESATRTNVFVPVLLGAGVILSLLASGVERLAGATAVPVLERRLSRRLGVLALPIGGLSPVAGAEATAAGLSLDLAPPPPPVPLDTRLAGVARRAMAMAIAVVLAAGTFSAIDIIADATQSRPDARPAGRVSELTLNVSIRDPRKPVLATANGLWVACQTVLRREVEASPARLLPDGRVRFTMTPALGEHAQRRFVGCLEDATLDEVQASVVSVRTLR